MVNLSHMNGPQLGTYGRLMEQHLVTGTERAICPKLGGPAGMGSGRSAAFGASCLKRPICKREMASAIILVVSAICVTITCTSKRAAQKYNIQRNLSNPVTFGPEFSGLIREVAVL